MRQFSVKWCPQTHIFLQARHHGVKRGDLNAPVASKLSEIMTGFQFLLLTFNVTRIGDREYVPMIWLKFTDDPYFIGWVFLFNYDRFTSFRYLKPPTERTEELSRTSTVSRTCFPFFWSSNTIIRSNKPRTTDIPVFNPLGSSQVTRI